MGSGLGLLIGTTGRRGEGYGSGRFKEKSQRRFMCRRREVGTTVVGVGSVQ